MRLLNSSITSLLSSGELFRPCRFQDQAALFCHLGCASREGDVARGSCPLGVMLWRLGGASKGMAFRRARLTIATACCTLCGSPGKIKFANALAARSYSSSSSGVSFLPPDELPPGRWCISCDAGAAVWQRPDSFSQCRTRHFFPSSQEGAVSVGQSLDILLCGFFGTSLEFRAKQ